VTVGTAPATCTATLVIEWAVSLGISPATDNAIAIGTPDALTTNILGNTADSLGNARIWLQTLDASSGNVQLPVLLTGAFAANAAKSMLQVGADAIVLATTSSNVPLVMRVTGGDTIAYARTLAPAIPNGFALTSDIPTALVLSGDGNLRVASNELLSFQGLPAQHVARLSTMTPTGNAVADVQICDTETINGCSGSCVSSTDVLAVADTGLSTIVVMRSAFSTTSAIIVASLTYSGGVQWAKRVSFADYTTIIPTAAAQLGGRVAVVGVAAQGTDLDGFYLEFTAAGAPGFASEYGFTVGRASTNEQIVGVGAGPSGTLLLAGTLDMSAFGAGADAWFVQIKTDGSLSTQAAFGGSGADIANTAAIAMGGGFLLAGRTSSFGAPDTQMWALRLEPNPLSFAFDPASGGHVIQTNATRGQPPVITTASCIQAQTTTLPVAVGDVTTSIVDPIFARQAP
jgi:hypothetical protein